MTYLNKNKSLTTLAVMTLFFLLPGMGIVNTAIQNITEAFPQVDHNTILLISTLPSLIMIPFSILSGTVVGSLIKYRTLVLLGVALYVVGGLAPVCLNDFTWILIFRGIFGIGFGIMFPLGNALILKLFDGQIRIKMVGLSNVIVCIGGIVLQLLGAALCSISWRYTFLAYIFGIISLVIVFLYLPNPEKEETLSAKRVIIPNRVYGLAIILVLCGIFVNPIMLNMSPIIIDGNLGNSSSVGIVLSMFTVGGILTSLVFGRLYNLMTKLTIVVGMIILASGLAFIFYGSNLWLLTIGSTIAGGGFFAILPAAMLDMAKITKPQGFALASGILIAALNIGNFLSPYYMDILIKVTGQSSLKFPMFIGMIFIVVISAIYTFINLKTVPEDKMSI